MKLMLRLGHDIPHLKSRADRLVKEETLLKSMEAKAIKAEATATKKAAKKKK